MDFDFTEDQQALRDAVRRFVDKDYGFERRTQIAHALHSGAVRRRDRQAQRQFAQQRPSLDGNAAHAAMLLRQRKGRG
ncbi:MAG TPA: acyl-CoA dehydrogenase, partial [Roseateles sp.]|nr:acyl-CoA dehydrogenase [Roseateles sp.]